MIVTNMINKIGRNISRNNWNLSFIARLKYYYLTILNYELFWYFSNRLCRKYNISLFNQ